MELSYKDILNTKSRFYCIGIYIHDFGEKLQLLEISIKNDDVNIEDRFETESLDELLGHAKKEYPILLHISGSGILSKRLDSNTSYRNEILFNADVEDFHFFEYKQEDDVYISVIRKELLSSYIEKINDKDKFVVDVSIGPFVLKTINTIFPDTMVVKTPFYELSFKGNLIDSFNQHSNSSVNTVINDEQFNEQELPLFASFLEYKFDSNLLDFDTTFLNKNKEEQKFKNWFKSLGAGMLFFYLASLFVGHFVLDSYTKKLAEKESQYAVSQQTLATLSAMRAEKELKEKILFTSGLNNTDYVAKFVLDICNSIPNAIELNTLEVFPLIRKARDNEKLNLDIDHILIEGESDNDTDFNIWLTELKHLEWIKKVELDYHQELKSDNLFSLKLSI
ncbi:hypothetical protein [Winogradskyella sp. 3972H.M.0a.05]|uniref:hypothetical protein n=1 Tax=Winogradskyella sp. 3972H.M.0a.05 TaxID=2950277 RepID=UPI003393F185